VEGTQLRVLWQASETGVDVICEADLPEALVPLWQLEQDPLTPEWSNRAGVHAVVEWQLPQSAVVEMWLAGLPVAVAPL